jgi:putative transposase
MDFINDELFDERRIRLLTLLDNFTRVSLAMEVDANISGQKVAEIMLMRMGREHSLPKLSGSIAGLNLSAKGLTNGGLI